MYPKKHQLNQGFALPAAIFVLVVLAAVVVAMMNLSATQTQVVNDSIQVSRANWAAQSGLDWAIYQIVDDTAAASCADATATKTIDGFSVVISCNSSNYEEVGFTNVTRYSLQATATPAGLTIDQPDYAFRAVEIDIVLEN